MDEQAGVEAQTGDVLLLRRKRALYRAQYRGTKEMDWMIGRYAVAKLNAMSLEQLRTFEEFLEIGDPQINAWLLAQATCEEVKFEVLINNIRAFHSLADQTV